MTGLRPLATRSSPVPFGITPEYLDPCPEMTSRAIIVAFALRDTQAVQAAPKCFGGVVV